MERVESAEFLEFFGFSGTRAGAGPVRHITRSQVGIGNRGTRVIGRQRERLVGSNEPDDGGSGGGPSMGHWGGGPMMGRHGTGGMSWPMMGLGVDMVLDRVDGRLAYLKTELKTTDDQTSAWDELSATKRNPAGT